jgi:hypothetical protein
MEPQFRYIKTACQTRDDRLQSLQTLKAKIKLKSPAKLFLVSNHRVSTDLLSTA